MIGLWSDKNRQLSSAKAPNGHCWWCVTKTICLEKSALGNYVGSANWIFSPTPFLIHILLFQIHDWQIIFAMPEKIFELDVTLFYCFIRHFYLPFLFEASLDSWHKDLTINSLSTLFAFHTPCPLCQLPFLLHFRAL